jgi:hypothetical protein
MLGAQILALGVGLQNAHTGTIVTSIPMMKMKHTIGNVDITINTKARLIILTIQPNH